MGEYKKLNKITWIVYTLALLLCLVCFWFFLGDEGGLGYALVFEWGIFGIIVPFVLTLVNSIIIGVSLTRTLVLPIIFGVGSIVCSFLTYNILWYVQGRGISYLLYIQWDRFIFGFVSSLAGLLVGIVIFGVKRLIEKNRISVQEV